MTQRQPREHNPQYLAWLRLRPCCVCGKSGPSEACHIRYTWDESEKRSVGMGEKPSDKWAIPMCPAHHRLQHSMNEEKFWLMVGKDPFVLAMVYYELANCKPSGSKPNKAKMRKIYRPLQSRDFNKRLKRKMSGEVIAIRSYG